MNIENLMTTAAFYSEGLHDVGYDRVIEAWGQGCIEMIREVSQYATLSELLVSEVYADHYVMGVYDYEVSAPFGEFFARYILANDGAAPSKQDAGAELVELTFRFFEVEDDATKVKAWETLEAWVKR